MRTVNDPYGSLTPEVDKLIGNAFPTVKLVADNMDAITYVVANMQAIITLAQQLTTLTNRVTALEARVTALEAG